MKTKIRIVCIFIITLGIWGIYVNLVSLRSVISNAEYFGIQSIDLIGDLIELAPIIISALLIIAATGAMFLKKWVYYFLVSTSIIYLIWGICVVFWAVSMLLKFGVKIADLTREAHMDLLLVFLFIVVPAFICYFFTRPKVKEQFK